MSNIFECPHCGGSIIIEQMNCRIFRHAYLRDGNVQLNPHAPKELIDSLLLANKLYGCGGPFRISENNKIEKCEYI